MNKFVVGTIVLTVGAITFGVLALLEIISLSITFVAMLVCTIGFCIQIYSAFKIRSEFNKDQEKKEKEHQIFLKEIESLTPEEEIQVILNVNREMSGGSPEA